MFTWIFDKYREGQIPRPLAVGDLTKFGEKITGEGNYGDFIEKMAENV